MALLTPGQEAFAARLAHDVGLDRNVIRAWELAEESGGYAVARERQGNHNWLNIGYFDSGAAPWAAKMFRDPVQGADLTAQFLRGQVFGAAAGIRAILTTAGKSPGVQIAAIAASGWASSGYNHGANLRATYRLVTGSPAPAVPVTPAPAPTPHRPEPPIPPAPASPRQDDYSGKVRVTGAKAAGIYTLIQPWAVGIRSLRR